MSDQVETSTQSPHPEPQCPEFDPRLFIPIPLDSPHSGSTDGRPMDQTPCPRPESSQHPVKLHRHSHQFRAVKAAPPFQVHLTAREKAILCVLAFLKPLCEYLCRPHLGSRDTRIDSSRMGLEVFAPCRGPPGVLQRDAETLVGVRGAAFHAYGSGRCTLGQLEQECQRRHYFSVLTEMRHQSWVELFASNA